MEKFSINSVILFITCLLSFSAVVLSVFTYLKLKKSFFANLIFINSSFFLIGANSYFSRLYGTITSPLFLLIFGTVLTIMFSYGIMNFSLGLVHVSMNAPIRMFTRFYSFGLVIVYLIFFIFVKKINFVFCINMLGIWIPALMAVIFFIILFKNVNKQAFKNTKIVLCITAIVNILFSVIFKMVPFFFICFAALFTIFLAYEYFITGNSVQAENEVTDEFVALYGITKREKEIINELLKGKTNKELAEIFFVTQKTIEVHLTNIYKKTGVKNRLELFSYLKK